jgi:hypothetical protein
MVNSFYPFVSSADETPGGRARFQGVSTTLDTNGGGALSA